MPTSPDPGLPTSLTRTSGLAGEPLFPEGDIDPGLDPYIDIAKNDLAGRLGIDAGNIETVYAVMVTWSDGSVGCPKPGVVYPQVLTDGSLIELRADGASYRYHSGGSSQPFLCDQPLLTPPVRTS